MKSKLEDISTLESAEKTAEERLSYVRASLRGSRVSASYSDSHHHAYHRCLVFMWR